METLGAILYFASILGGLPAFVALNALALVRLRSFMRLAALVPAVYVGWILIGEFAPVLLHAQQMEPSDFRRLLYERWSAASRPALTGTAVVLALLLFGKRKRRCERQSALRRPFERRPTRPAR